MNILDYFEIIKYKIFRGKKNKFMLIQFIIGTLFLISAITFKYNFVNLIENTLFQNINFRSLSVTVKTDKADLGKKELESINHVELVYSSKYDVYSVDTSLKSDKLDGKLDLLYGDSNTIPEIIYGRSISNDESGVAICPLEFYPSSKAYNLFIKQDELLNGEDYIDTNFEATYYSYKESYGSYEIDKTFNKTFKIIGIYDSNSVMNSRNSCYISTKDIIEMKDKDSRGGEETYYNFNVIVDNLNNISSVKDEILNLGFLDVSLRGELDTKTINVILMSCNIVISVIIFTIGMITILYIKKKQIYENKFNGILRGCGCSKKQVLIINILEQFVINLLSYVLGILVFTILFYGLKEIIINNILATSLIIILPLYSYIWTFVIMCILTTILDMIFIIKNNSKDVVKMIRSEI